MAKRKRCLVIDDDINVRNVLDVKLRTREMYDVDLAADGAEGLALARKHAPDLIILDVRMPGMDGYEVCRQLKADSLTKDIPVIFATALDQAGDEEKGLNLGAIDYVTKPLSLPILCARARNHIELKAYRDSMENMAMLDGLTGIANRRRFDDFLAVEWKRAGRNKTPLSVILMDIDFFKPFNDNYGHASGDRCLKQVAQALSDSLVRPADLIARYGGEEFVCVLPETGGEGALKIANKLLEAVRAERVPHEYSVVSDIVTMSLGCITVEADQDMTPDRIIEEVDKLLYRSKEGGRNRATAQVVGG